MLPDLLYDYAMCLVGLPYRWGGENAISGFDCSGLAIELLKSQGILPGAGDWSAQQLHDLFAVKGTVMDEHIDHLPIGTLAFYGASDKAITHVATILEDGIIIEAGGGGHTTVDVATAIKQNAVIRLRPLHNRRDLVALIHPLPAQHMLSSPSAS